MHVWALPPSPSLPKQEIEAQEVENSAMRRQAMDARRAGKLTEDSRRKMFAVRGAGLLEGGSEGKEGRRETARAQ